MYAILQMLQQRLAIAKAASRTLKTEAGELDAQAHTSRLILVQVQRFRDSCRRRNHSRYQTQNHLRIESKRHNVPCKLAASLLQIYVSRIYLIVCVQTAMLSSSQAWLAHAF